MDVAMTPIEAYAVLRDAINKGDSEACTLGEMLAIHAKHRRTTQAGYCTEGEKNCVCGGDTPGVRAQCSNWRAYRL